MDLAADRPSIGGKPQTDRVLVFSVDDGLFGVHLDWVEAVYEAKAVELHRVRVEKGPWHFFLLQNGEPALVTDLREAFDVADVLGQPERSAYAVIQSGGYRLAVAIDQVSGVQDLALDSHPPVPANLQRDGGIPVGHIVQMDDRMLVVLDPHRLLSGARRRALEPIWSRARSYGERHERMKETWREVCTTPTEENVRAYSRLCGRNGRPKAAAAARAVLKAMADPQTGLQTNGAIPKLVDQLVGEVVRRAGSRSSGILEVAGDDGPTVGALFFADGRVVDAQYRSEWGRMALRSLLALDGGRVSFNERNLGDHPERLAESSVASLISTMEDVAMEQRKRRSR
jgi:chemotaxis signal transduction protein